MEKRNCVEVVMQMIKKIPEEKGEFIKDLRWNAEDASYKAPEESIQWMRTQETLVKHIPLPREDWEFEVISIFTTKSVGQLKEECEGAKAPPKQAECIIESEIFSGDKDLYWYDEFIEKCVEDKVNLIDINAVRPRWNFWVLGIRSVREKGQ